MAENKDDEDGDEDNEEGGRSSKEQTRSLQAVDDKGRSTSNSGISGRLGDGIW